MSETSDIELMELEDDGDEYINDLSEPLEEALDWLILVQMQNC